VGLYKDEFTHKKTKLFMLHKTKTVVSVMFVKMKFSTIDPKTNEIENWAPMNEGVCFCPSYVVVVTDFFQPPCFKTGFTGRWRGRLRRKNCLKNLYFTRGNMFLPNPQYYRWCKNFTKNLQKFIWITELYHKYGVLSKFTIVKMTKP